MHRWQSMDVIVLSGDLGSKGQHDADAPVADRAKAGHRCAMAPASRIWSRMGVVGASYPVSAGGGAVSVCSKVAVSLSQRSSSASTRTSSPAPQRGVPAEGEQLVVTHDELTQTSRGRSASSSTLAAVGR